MNYAMQSLKRPARLSEGRGKCSSGVNELIQDFEGIWRSSRSGDHRASSGLDRVDFFAALDLANRFTRLFILHCELVVQRVVLRLGTLLSKALFIAYPTEVVGNPDEKQGKDDVSELPDPTANKCPVHKPQVATKVIVLPCKHIKETSWDYDGLFEDVGHIVEIHQQKDCLDGVDTLDAVATHQDLEVLLAHDPEVDGEPELEDQAQHSNNYHLYAHNETCSLESVDITLLLRN